MFLDRKIQHHTVVKILLKLFSNLSQSQQKYQQVLAENKTNMRFRKPGIQEKTDKIIPRMVREGCPSITAVHGLKSFQSRRDSKTSDQEGTFLGKK